MDNETIKIKKENVIAVYRAASEDKQELLKYLFGEELFNPKDVTERIKTFEDACRELEERGDDVLVRQYHSVTATDIVDANLDAYLKLRIICAALNEGWEPKFTEKERRYYPWIWLYTQDEINTMDEQWKQVLHLISTDDYKTGYAGFGFACSAYAPSHTNAYLGSRLCLNSGTLAEYCGKQFTGLWADFLLIRK